jgi:hypothetical protein
VPRLSMVTQWPVEFLLCKLEPPFIFWLSASSATPHRRLRNRKTFPFVSTCLFATTDTSVLHSPIMPPKARTIAPAPSPQALSEAYHAQTRIDTIRKEVNQVIATNANRRVEVDRLIQEQSNDPSADFAADIHSFKQKIAFDEFTTARLESEIQALEKQYALSLRQAAIQDHALQNNAPSGPAKPSAPPIPGTSIFKANFAPVSHFPNFGPATLPPPPTTTFQSLATAPGPLTRARASATSDYSGHVSHTPLAPPSTPNPRKRKTASEPVPTPSTPAPRLPTAIPVMNGANDLLTQLSTMMDQKLNPLAQRLTVLEDHRSARSRSTGALSHRPPASVRTAPPPPPAFPLELQAIIPANADGMPPPSIPRPILDARHILWPHISTQTINDVLSNKIDVSKLHLLMPLEFGIMNDEIEIPDDTVINRLAKVLDGEETTENRTMKLSKIAKGFPSPSHWVAALTVWMGIKSAYGARQIWAASVMMHIAQVGRLNYLYGWQTLVNYEIAFFSRYHTIDTPETMWAQEDASFKSTYLHTILERRRHTPAKRQGSNQPPRNGPQSTSSNYCRRFNTSDDCHGECKYQHRCSLDPTRCTGAHPAFRCPNTRNANPPRRLNDRISGNPNDTPLGNRVRNDSSPPPPHRRRNN